MNKIEQKYGIQENASVKDYHKNRRMFCVFNNGLHIAPSNVTYSHAYWFEQEGWTKIDENLIDNIMRGIVDINGNISFYVGYDFLINETVEKIFFEYLKEIVKKLNLDTEKEIFGGWIRGEPGTIWRPYKTYGKIKDYIR